MRIADVFSLGRHGDHHDYRYDRDDHRYDRDDYHRYDRDRDRRW